MTVCSRRIVQRGPCPDSGNIAALNNDTFLTLEKLGERPFNGLTRSIVAGTACHGMKDDRHECFLAGSRTDFVSKTESKYVFEMSSFLHTT